MPPAHELVRRGGSWARRGGVAAAALATALGAAGQPPPTAVSDPVAFTIVEGAVSNHFYRHGTVAAHVLTTSGRAPRLIVAFPAGNTGVAVWFGELAMPAQLTLAPDSRIEGIERDDGMRGVKVRLRCAAPELTISHPVLANIRTIRDFIASGMKSLPPEFRATAEVGPPAAFRRTTLDGRHHVEARVAPEAGTSLVVDHGTVTLRASSGAVEFTVVALADDEPLTPFAPGELFAPAVAPLPEAQEVFAFLASREKLTAGSWRFLTYFGRDTLLSVQMLMPVLQPGVIEAALGSVLERLGRGGEVAHEEAIGEFAVWENLHRTPRPDDLLAPVLDYKMIDGEFLLAPAMAAYLLDTPAGRSRAAGFLARKTRGGLGYAELLRRNLALVLARAAPFADSRRPTDLVALKAGAPVGDWRDSDNGLGGGRFPFDVNVTLVPAALDAASRLYASGVLGPQSGPAATAGRLAEAWKGVERVFQQTVPVAEARHAVEAYARSQGLDPAPAVSTIKEPVIYDALSLDGAGRPVPVMHSDVAFRLFFGDPPGEFLDRVARQLIRPFPAGLLTDVGMVVANPVFGGADVWRRFTRGDYHGTVVWSWQQALMAAGLARQLRRPGLPEEIRGRLRQAQGLLWERITALQRQSAGELWSWEPQDGRATLAPFGQGRGHVDESNAAQLWSTVYLAIRPPRAGGDQAAPP